MLVCQWCGAPTLDMVQFAREIVNTVAMEHGVSVGQLLSPSRKRDVVVARACAIGRMRRELDMPLKAIGYVLGRDHSTLIHHLKKQEQGGKHCWKLMSRASACAGSAWCMLRGEKWSPIS